MKIIKLKNINQLNMNYLSLGGLPTIGDSEADEPRSRVREALDPRLNKKVQSQINQTTSIAVLS